MNLIVSGTKIVKLGLVRGLDEFEADGCCKLIHPEGPFIFPRSSKGMLFS